MPGHAAKGKAAPGLIGRRGHSGHKISQEGRHGEPGSVDFVTITSDGRILERSIDRYEVTVSSFNVHDQNRDGIFEPGSMCLIDGIEIFNSGSMHLPEGCRLSFTTTTFGNISSKSILLPCVAPGHSVVLPDAVSVALPDIQMPEPRGHESAVPSETIRGVVSILGRNIQSGESKMPVPIAWPIYIRNVDVPPFLGPFEEGHVRVSIANLSRKTYDHNSPSRVIYVV